MNTIRYALEALGRGFHVFPVEPGEKTPHTLTPGEPYTLRWGEAATNSKDRVIDYWARWPDSNIGIAAKPSGLLIVDCDLPKQALTLDRKKFPGFHDRFGTLFDGSDAFQYLCERNGGNWSECWNTFRVCTGSLGCHYYYLWPGWVTPPEASQASLVKGLVDIRSNGGQWGGYVLGWGSVTSKGAYRIEHFAPVRPVPAWLVGMVRGDKPRPRLDAGFRQPTRGGVLSGLVATVERAEQGNRNQALLWAARAACADGIPLDDVLDALSAAYVSAGGDGGHRQAEATVRSAYRLQGRKGA